MAGGRPPAGLSDRPEPGSGPGVSSARPAAAQAVVQVVSWCMWLGRVVGSASRRLGVGVGWVDQNRILLGLRVARRGRRLPMRCAPCVAPRVPPRPSRVAPTCIAALSPSLTRPFFTHSLSVSLCPHCLASRYGQGEHRTRLTTHESRVRVRYCGGAEAEHSQQSGQRTRNGGSICPAPFSFHVTHTFVLHCMCCQRDLHAIRPCGGCKPPIS